MNNFKREIHERALIVARNFKRAEAGLIQILQEVDDSKLFLDLQKTSLYQYAVEVLELPENIALNFINVARKAKTLPVLQLAINDGSVSVSKVKKVTSVLTLENQNDWIEKIKTCSSKQLEKEVAKINPQEAAPERTKYVSEDRLELRMGISQEILDQLKRVQNLESKRTSKAVSLEETLKSLLKVYLETKDPLKRAERVLGKKLQVLRPAKRFSQSDNKKPIPAQEKHETTLRDQGQCKHEIDGKRCENKRWTEIHHIIPRALGGDHSLENLTTLCSTHHKMVHRSV